MTWSARTRVDFGGGGLLTADDYLREQAYHLESQALRCRSLHTWGVVSGLSVSLADSGMAVCVSAGIALDRTGRQITLTAPRKIAIGDRTATVMDLGIALETALADWRVDPLGAGYGRCVDKIVVSLVDDRATSTDNIVILARLTFGPGRRLRPPDLKGRVQCGLKAARVDMMIPDGATPCPRLYMESDGTSLAIAAEKTDLFGALRVTGTVTVGAETRLADITPAARPALVVNIPRPTRGKGKIGIVGSLVFGMPRAEVSGLMSGDRLEVSSTGGASQAEETRNYAIASISGPTVTLSTTVPSALRTASYSYAKSMLFRVRSAPSRVALGVSTSGRIGVGGEAGAARLCVRDGDLKVQDAVRFVGDGAIQAGPYGSPTAATHTIKFQASRNCIEIVESGTISFQAGILSTTPGLTLAANQNVGIGVTAPTHRLVVGGVLRVSAGIVFSDGTQQNESASDLPIGTVFSLWCPTGSTIQLADNLRRCDGTVIDDATSPLHGQRAPDLRSRFVRGAPDVKAIGKTGGDPTHAHAWAMPQHAHDIPHAHAIAGTTISVLGGSVAMVNLQDGSRMSAAVHAHEIDTTSSESNPSTTGDNTPVDPIETSSVETLPPYMMLLKVIRIK